MVLEPGIRRSLAGEITRSAALILYDVVTALAAVVVPVPLS